MSDQPYSHVAAAFRDWVDLEPKERIAKILQDRWIEYARGRTVLTQIERCRLTFGRERPESLLVYGPSGVGKTAIKSKFTRDHAGGLNTASGTRVHPVVSVQMPPEPLEHDFFIAIVRALNGPHQNYSRSRTARDAAISLLQYTSCQILLVDDIQNTYGGTARQQRIFLNNLRWLSNEIRQPIVCLGTQDASGVFDSDPQLRTRFRRMPLEPWVNDVSGYKRFVLALQQTLPLRQRSCLGESDALNLLLRTTSGITADIIRIVESAAVAAIEDGSEMIRLEALEAACELYRGC